MSPGGGEAQAGYRRRGSVCVEAEHAVAERPVCHCKPFQFAPAREPGFQNVSVHVMRRIEGIGTQGPPHCAIATSHSAKCVGGLDKFTSDRLCVAFRAAFPIIGAASSPAATSGIARGASVPAPAPA